MALLKNFACALLIVFVIGAATVPQAASALTCTGMDKACGDSIFRYLVKNVGPPPANDCCSELVKFGKACHDEYVQMNVKAKAYQGTLQQFLQRSDNLWNRCTVVGTIVGAPSPIEE